MSGWSVYGVIGAVWFAGFAITLLSFVLWPKLTPEEIRNDMSELGAEAHAGYGLWWSVLWPVFWTRKILSIVTG